MEQAADGSAMVRVRVEVQGKGVARRGAALWAEDLPGAEGRNGAEIAKMPMLELPAEALMDTVKGHTAEPSEEQMAHTSALPMAVAAPLGHVTSEVPRGAARGATAMALCSTAALQRLR